MRSLGYLLLFILSYILSIYHLGTAPVMELDATRVDSRSQWIPKDKMGVHQLVLFGTPLERGNFAGQATRELLYRQEVQLQQQLKEILPSVIARGTLFLLAMRWFWGIERFLEKGMLEEMWGVAQSTSQEFDSLADRFTRQIAYHGLHEVGQTFVDMNPEAAGCTVVAFPHEGSWLIGRNFDFEGGRIFDEEKILKWVYPEKGYPYLSVIWAGMVGAVTGVNEHGVYISINAAGSTDFKRIGTPSTLVLTQALQFSKTAEEARRIIESMAMFITDIFVVADRNSQKLYRIEKSPERVVTLTETQPLVIANHLIHSQWADDRINDFRRDRLTSIARERRGQELLKSISIEKRGINMERKLLSIIRDKAGEGGGPLHLGNRNAIDALIASHSVIWSAKKGVLYVSQGPSLVGPFLGFDLKRSFAERKPVRALDLPADTQVDTASYAHIHLALKKIQQAEKNLKRSEFEGAKLLLDEARIEHVSYYTVLGDYYWAKGEESRARVAWQDALRLKPAYARERDELKRKLEKTP